MNALMKQLILSIICLAISCRIYAQSMDSMVLATASMPQDTHLVLAYQELFYAYYDADKQAEMLETAEKGLVLSRKLQFIKGIDFFLFFKATTLDIMGKGKEALPFFEEGMQIAQQQGDQKGVATYRASIGTAYYSLGDLEKGLENFLAAYYIYKALGLQKNLSKVLNNIGIIYRTQKKYDRAEAIYKESLAIKESLKDTLGIAASYQNLAALLSTSAREQEMIAYLHKALAIYETRHKKSDAAGCYSLLGQIYYNLDRMDLAKMALLKSVELFANKPSPEYSSNVYRLLGSVAIKEKTIEKAERYLQESLKYAQQFGQKDRLWDILFELSTAQHLLGKNDEAYQSLQASYALRDSATVLSRLSIINEMQTKFDVVQKDNELKINQLDLAKRTLERNWVLAVALLLGCLSLAIFFGFRHRIRTNKKLAQQASELQQQRILQLEQAAQLDTLNAMIEGQEQERTRIANDLHDGLGGLLTSVKAHFNGLKKTTDEQALFQKTNQLIDDACVEVRRISHNMMPRALAISGLQGALEDLSFDLEKQGIHCNLEIIGLDIPIDTAKSVVIYRIIQELVNNVAKHADADHLLLQLLLNDKTLTIIVEDNGKGFDLENKQLNKGLGRSSIESRVKFLQGTITWDAVLGEGVMVSIEVPL
jgi:two-component system, NarL family, sensor kinase